MPDEEAEQNSWDGYEDYLDSLTSLATELGRPPTTEEFRAQTAHHPTTGSDHFGSWAATIEAAGLDPEEVPDPGRPKIPEDEYLDAVRALANDLGRPPSSLEMHHDGEYSHSTGIKRWGGWAVVIEAAGLDPTAGPGGGPQKEIPDEMYLEAVSDLAEELGRPPTWDEMRNQGRYSATVGQERWDRWADVVAAAGLNPDQIPTGHGSDPIDREEYLEAIRAVAKELGRPPTTQEMNEHGEYTAGVAYRIWDSWSEALEAAGIR
jgi:hypothetical protein